MPANSATTDTPEARRKISDLSRLTEEVLLLLLTENAELRSRVEAAEAEADRRHRETRERMDREAGEIRQVSEDRRFSTFVPVVYVVPSLFCYAFFCGEGRTTLFEATLFE